VTRALQRRRKIIVVRKGRNAIAVGTAAVCLVTLVAGAAAAGRTNLSFAPGPLVPAGPAPVSAALADLNGDGKLDVAVGNGGYWNDVRVLLGDGAGGFGEHGSPVALGAYPREMTSADFDRDGNADLAIVTGARLVRILLGDGSGGVAAANGASVDAGGEPFGLLHADLNDDGDEDLLVPVRRNGYRVGILLGNGTGGFAAPSELSIGGSTADAPRVSVVAADLTGDGKPDLAAANSSSNAIWLWRGNGSGGFGSRQTIATAKRPGPLAVGDVNRDGEADLVAVVGKGTEALLGDGKGGYRAAGPPAAVRGGSLVLADFNGDSTLDVAVADGAAGRIYVALGNGSGRFAPVALSPLATLATVSISPGDFNGDGKTDLFDLSWVGEAWWPSPSGTSVLLQTAATPAVPAPPQRMPRGVVLSTRTPIELLAADAGRAAVVTARDKRACGPVVVWTPSRRAIRSFKRGYLGCQGDGVGELALSDRQVAWIEEGGGNNLELTVMLGNLTGRSAKQVDYETNGDRAGGDPTGDWVGQLQGGGSVLAYNAWDVGCAHLDPDGEYCDWVSVGKRDLVQLSSGRRRIVRSGPDSFPLAAAGGGRLAVATDSAVRVYGATGKLVTSVPNPSEDPARAVALSTPRLAVERTFGIDLYSSSSGTKTKSLALGPAAALRLAAVSSKLALLRGPRRIVLVRLADGRLASLPLISQTGQPLVDVRLTDAGLFFAYNVKKTVQKGRVAFVSTAALLRRF
jgi:FG-GAP-like repeat